MKKLYLFGIILGFLLSGCTYEQEINSPTINNEAPAREFYQASLQSVVSTKCLNCHNHHTSGESKFDSFEKLSRNLPEILNRLEARGFEVMPPAEEIQLTHDEKQLFKDFKTFLEAQEGTNPISTEPEETPDILVNWTAYKFPFNRAGVTGKFDSLEVISIGKYQEEEPLAFLENGAFRIPTNTAAIGDDSLKTSNIRNYFFKHMAPTIEGEVVSIQNDTVLVNIALNLISQEIPFHIAEHTEYKLTLAGKIEDMAYFNWVDAFNNLQRACGFYHQGLVWSDVDLKITFKLKE
ncbi:MAG: hypothetical protein AAGC85_17405 [Bacteroidota bacterium]